MTRLNSCDFYQLIAMIVLARRSGLLPIDVNLAIVRGAHVGDYGNTAPTFVQKVYGPNGEPDGTATTFLHHSLVASRKVPTIGKDSAHIVSP